MIDKFLDRLSRDHSARTVESYRYGLGVWSKYINGKDVSKVSKGDIVLFREWLEEQKFSGKSCNLIMAAVRRYFTYLYERDIVQTNHATLLRPFSTFSKPKSIDMSTFRAILNAVKADDYALAMLYTLMRFSGLRLSEALRVQGSDMKWDLSKGYAIINNVKGKGGQVTTAYYVPLISGGSQSDVTEMMEYAHSTKGPFLPEETYNSIATLTWKKSKKIKIKFSCHSFRHSFAYGLLSNNVEISDIASFMRHKSTKVTEEIYLKMDVKLRNQYIEKVIDKTMPTILNEGEQI